MEKRIFNAETINLDEVLEFIDSQLKKSGCNMKTQMQIDVAAEEIFVNVAHYAYKPDIGPVEVCVELKDDPRRVCVTFIDRGRPFDPLEKPDPDITLSADEREVGGLGIYMVKKTMDDVIYKFSDGQNHLTMVKNF